MSETCEICGCLQRIGAEGPIKECSACGHKFGVKITFHIDTVEDATSQTHDRYSWFCKECEHRGLKWVEHEQKIPGCPNCGASRLHMIVKGLDPSTGRCKTIWDPTPLKTKNRFHAPILPNYPPIQTEPIDSPIQTSSIKKGKCRNCGRIFIFHTTFPKSCSWCGAEGNDFILGIPRND